MMWLLGTFSETGPGVSDPRGPAVQFPHPTSKWPCLLLEPRATARLPCEVKPPRLGPSSAAAAQMWGCCLSHTMG